MKLLELSRNIVAVYEEFPDGSEVNLFGHNEFLGRRWLPVTGKALAMRLQLMVATQVHAPQQFASSLG